MSRVLRDPPGQPDDRARSVIEAILEYVTATYPDIDSPTRALGARHILAAADAALNESIRRAQQDDDRIPADRLRKVLDVSLGTVQDRTGRAIGWDPRAYRRGLAERRAREDASDGSTPNE